MDDRLAFMRQGGSSKLPVETVFENRHEQAKGEVALQYWSRRDKSSSPPEQLTLFILGNPGLLNYYIPFLNHLHSLLPPSHALLSTSHIGHTPGLKCPDQPVDLPSQLEAKIELVQALRGHLHTWSKESDAPPPKLALMGHSVGAWFTCEVMKRLGDRIHAGYLLFPTLGWIADSWNGRILWPIFTRPARTLLPLLAPLLRPILPITTFPPTTLSLLRSSTTIQHVLSLSKSEMDLIKTPDLDWIQAQRSQNPTEGLFGAWSAGKLDGWVGREGPMVRECLGGDEGDRVELLKGVPHAFCLSQDHSELVARVVASWVIHKQLSTSETIVHDAPSLEAELLPM